MNTFDCIRSRRSIRQFKPDKIGHSLLEHIISIASYAPSWKNTQIARYIAIDDASILQTIASDHLPDFNSRIVSSAPLLIALTFLKNRSGFERDGSFSTPKNGEWQMFDAGIAAQTFCLAAHEAGLGSVIMGVFDIEGISRLLHLPDTQELAALIAVGYPDEAPDAPRRKTTEQLLTYLQEENK